ncbi:hypothetical protein SARC_13426 [Sphaeroforma arctica JP610]|uniref:Ribosomal protein S16 n=1 Tax=Sphaeroforma arctica JP610 TaxID=667725 RepID=A0A0L0FBZ5_9EUKA|nr:hypothetical protein SARC_13426 [Sphaeroforma arctica JP610]KNC74016.1 hypothetical protein SARC_13426 [Sphaeroforma arctica JP610]|eukprot:XP_014147918.1 hypothetical protein SARC_13426 [Sphaeroforma arctica JP610]
MFKILYLSNCFPPSHLSAFSFLQLRIHVSPFSVVADGRCKRDGKFIEHVGTYEAIPNKNMEKHTMMNTERIKYWISVGAQPTKPVARLLAQAGLIPPPPGFEARRLMREKLIDNPTGTTPFQKWMDELPQGERKNYLKVLNHKIRITDAKGRCGYCHDVGHGKDTCPVRKEDRLTYKSEDSADAKTPTKSKDLPKAGSSIDTAAQETETTTDGKDAGSKKSSDIPKETEAAQKDTGSDKK